MVTGEGMELEIADEIMDRLTDGEIAHGDVIPGWSRRESEAYWKGVDFGTSEVGGMLEALADCLHTLPGSNVRAKALAELTCLLVPPGPAPAAPTS